MCASFRLPIIKIIEANIKTTVKTPKDRYPKLLIAIRSSKRKGYYENDCMTPLIIAAMIGKPINVPHHFTINVFP